MHIRAQHTLRLLTVLTLMTIGTIEPTVAADLGKMEAVATQLTHCSENILKNSELASYVYVKDHQQCRTARNGFHQLTRQELSNEDVGKLWVNASTSAMFIVYDKNKNFSQINIDRKLEQLSKCRKLCSDIVSALP